METKTPENSALPQIADLYNDFYLTQATKEHELLKLCNCQPPGNWVKEHPCSETPYLPIDKIEFLLTNIFTKWWVEIRDTKLIANSVAVTVRLFYKNPITEETEFQDGVGAQPLQTKSGAGATDFNALLSNAVSLALPAAESYAIKDAAEKLGKLFGKDLNRKDTMAYDGMIDKKLQGLKDRAQQVLSE